MAIAWGFVLLVRLTPAAAAALVKLVRYVETGDPTRPFTISRELYDRLAGSTESDAELGAALSEHLGYSATVATYNEPFELRQFQVIFNRTPGGTVGDDVALFTTHHLKLSGGSPSSEWAAADFATVVDNWGTAWSNLAPWFPTGTAWARTKAYKAGPDIAPPQVAVYDNERPVPLAGTSASPALPPQVALSVTERAGSKLHWGRLYLPAPASDAAPGDTLTATGRPTSAFLTAVANELDTFVEACRVGNVPLVVYRRPLPERQNAAGATLPARAGSAWTVETLAVDDVYDVMRSRRWKAPTLRVLRGIGA